MIINHAASPKRTFQLTPCTTTILLSKLLNQSHVVIYLEKKLLVNSGDINYLQTTVAKAQALKAFMVDSEPTIKYYKASYC